jgi:outer membrane murein-binding lipoprotein Lpp
MRRTLTVVAAVAVAGALLAGATGCTRVKLQDNPATATQTLNKTVDLGGATRLKTDIAMGVGELTLSGTDATGTAMTGTFVFAPATWKPEIAYSVEATAGTLSIDQPKNTNVQLFDNVKNTWDVRIAKGVPTDLHLTLGVGKSSVDLRGVDLSALAVDTGVGETTLDLSGARTTGFTGRVNAGVGKLTLRLPRGVGARVTGGNGGLGDFTADGISVNSDSWVNDAWSGTGPKIDIALNRGVGEVAILLVD